MKLRRLFGRGDEPEGLDDEVADGDADAIDDNEVEADEAEVDDAPVSADADADADDEAEDEDEDEDEDDEADGDEDAQIAFELADWGARERRLIDAELDVAGVRRAWEASTLVVGAADADLVDDLIDEIEERVALDLPSDVEPVIYDVSDWPQGLEERLVDSLIDERIPHLRSYREVRVGRDDEERVDGLVEAVTQAWEDEIPTEDELDGPDAQQVLSELFVSADRLLHDAGDSGATVRFDDAATSTDEMGVPFGFVEKDWTEITDLVGALRDVLADAGSTDDDVVEAATALRTHLRPLV